MLPTTIVPSLSTNAWVLDVALMSAKSQFRVPLGSVEQFIRLLIYLIFFYASCDKDSPIWVSTI